MTKRLVLPILLLLVLVLVACGDWDENPIGNPTPIPVAQELSIVLPPRPTIQVVTIGEQPFPNATPVGEQFICPVGYKFWITSITEKGFKWECRLALDRTEQE
ncbi:hypothetical protein A2363_05305 [Candidatus Gottesmanbacteria bacterium RIFOXYB1_FULL_47_11]|uniref:Lipoprotein n=1 Tax=Candidatus Gottesmanbacteria bacterium RIFOXYB1_FULL_47_11 TaxID=1798401 RepID=A0A1F6BE58_9BACT|nr:MAG: hypothetical protein A2363_05305 [Candidatus Gottesmanbacteria bacterium RIFOXYB1_FULL_47_11]